MLQLPRSNPLYEQLAVSRVSLPDALKKLGSGGFTGYLGYASPDAEAYLVFIKGALVSMLLLEQQRRSNGFEALNGLFSQAARGSGVINLYRMTVDIALCTHALLHGEAALLAQKVAVTDLKALITRIQTEQINGTMLFTSPDRSAMAFYKQGVPVGFYHDSAHDIATAPVEIQRVAALPDATVELRTITASDTLLHHNFLETLNIDRLWQAVQNREPSTKSPQPTPPVSSTTPAAPSEPIRQQPAAPSLPPDQLAEVTDDLQEIVKAYLGRAGAALVDRLLADGGGPEALSDQTAFELLLKGLAAQGAQLDPEAKLDEMLDLIRSEVAGRLAL